MMEQQQQHKQQHQSRRRRRRNLHQGMMRTVHVRFSLILIVTVLLLTSAVSAFLPSVTPTSRKVDLSSTRTAAICHANNKNNFLTTWKARLFQKQRRQQQQQQQEKEEKEEQEEQEEQEERQERRNDYEKRKLEWASEHTSVDALRKKFGENQNQMWGDLDARTCRRLYKTLLPKALLELYRVGIEPQDLAPLAYEARLAAKLYARERCVVPARLAAHSYDGFRHWKRYGRFQCTGMTYKQLWEKYRQAILQEDDENNNNNNNNDYNDNEETETILEWIDRITSDNDNNNNTLSQSQVRPIRYQDCITATTNYPTECSICLDEFTTDDELVETIPCNHLFHRHCCQTWLDTNATVRKRCPVCRTYIGSNNNNNNSTSNNNNLNNNNNNNAPFYGSIMS
uniref:RING-type domain-containing protein n=1 Tax=Cyclophora tenuis TaxID=216820 RepID=A0A7S1D2F8_CYCTE|mmetsp:Transcript_17794/g.30228  ORF Transcript_17794/g.30228 Transcript_17794/m.30228 type:complete len:398 (+) Transcript_17794:45-1238(+)